jgi:hypothetical protein
MVSNNKKSLVGADTIFELLTFYFWYYNLKNVINSSKNKLGGNRMNIFNKIIVVMILLFFIFASLVSIINEFIGFFSWSEIAQRVFNPANDINPYISTLALLMILTVCIFLMLLEFYRKKIRIAKIYNVESGKAMITVGTITQQIKDAVSKIEGLKDVKVSIISKSNGIIINMMVGLVEGVNIPDKMNEIIEKASSVAKEKLNIMVIDTNLTIISLAPEEKAPETKTTETKIEKEAEKYLEETDEEKEVREQQKEQ